jgi:methanogenic corrinoid protein MtbC1
MMEVGRLFEQGEYFVPEMLVAARAPVGPLTEDQRERSRQVLADVKLL